jgi:hypothetical protein
MGEFIIATDKTPTDGKATNGFDRRKKTLNPTIRDFISELL